MYDTSEIKAKMLYPLKQIFKLQVMPIVYYVATKSKAIAFYRQITLDGIGCAHRKKLQSFYLQNIQAIHTTVYYGMYLNFEAAVPILNE